MFGVYRVYGVCGVYRVYKVYDLRPSLSAADSWRSGLVEFRVSGGFERLGFLGLTEFVGFVRFVGFVGFMGFFGFMRFASSSFCWGFLPREDLEHREQKQSRSPDDLNPKP